MATPKVKVAMSPRPPKFGSMSSGGKKGGMKGGGKKC